MSDHTFMLPRALRPHGLAFFISHVPYCSAHITDFHISDSDGGQTLFYSLSPTLEADHVSTLLGRVFEMAADFDLDYPSKILFEQSQSSDSGSIVDLSRLEDQIVPLSDGIYIFGPAFSRLVRWLDDWVVSEATSIGAQEYTLPAYTTRSVLDRCNYLKTFPQHLTFAFTVERDLDAIGEFVERQDPDEQRKHLVQSELVAAPAACLNCYAMLEGRTVSNPTLLTVLGLCSRYEAGRMRDPSRLWNFRMREIVFLGTKDKALAFRDQWRLKIEDLLRLLKLPCRIESATDPFFTTERSSLLTYQLAFDLKYEIVGLLPGGAKMAIGSLNYHQQHFGGAFNIKGPDQKPVHTACVAFGLERWAYWMLSHYGTEEEGWAKIKEALEG